MLYNRKYSFVHRFIDDLARWRVLIDPSGIDLFDKLLSTVWTYQGDLSTNTSFRSYEIQQLISTLVNDTRISEGGGIVHPLGGERLRVIQQRYLRKGSREIEISKRNKRPPSERGKAKELSKVIIPPPAPFMDSKEVMMGRLFIDVVLLLYSTCLVLRMPCILIEADNLVLKTLSAAPLPGDELRKLEIADPHVRSCVIVMMFLDVLPTSISEQEKLRSRFQYSDELVKHANHALYPQ